MASGPAHLFVAWSGAETRAVRSLLAAGRLPVLGPRLAAHERLLPLRTPRATPLAQVLSLITGTPPSAHGLLTPVQPAPDGRAWQPVHAGILPEPPFWDRLAAAGIAVAAIGWPGTHGAAPHPLRFVASDLDLTATDLALQPLAPLTGDRGDDLVRVAPQDLEPGLLGFFIPQAELPANPAADPIVRALLWYLARVYSAHNTAIAQLTGDRPPAFLAVHYELPAFPAAVLRRHPQLAAAALRLLDLLLGDLLQHAPEAALTLAGLAPGQPFAVTATARAPQTLHDLAPGLLAACGVSPNHAALSTPAAPVDEALLLHRYRALGVASDAMLAGPPAPAALRQHRAVQGRLLLAEGQPLAALSWLAQDWFQTPENVDAALGLYECLHLLGLRAEAREVAGTLRDHARTGPAAHFIEAQLALRHLNQPARALPLLAALRTDPQYAEQAAPLYREALLLLRRFAEARALMEAAIADETATAETHTGLAFALLHLGEIPAAEAAAQTAIGLSDRRPHPQRVLELIAGRRQRRPLTPDLPGWDQLLEQAEQREAHRVAYARLRTEFLAARTAHRARIVPVAFTDGAPAIPPDATWTIVSGLPRAGLSLLLRMLAFGGHPVLTDGRRPPDAHNPLGYFEWAPAARLQALPRLIDEAAGHALKLPAASLAHLPRDRHYRVLFVTRDPAMLARSQAAVRGLPPPPPEAAADLARRMAECLTAARAEAAFDVLEIPYEELRLHPAEWAARLAEFLGPALVRRPAAMAAAVHPDLPRHRSA